ncbi:MAG: alpha/beta hydrolase [Terracidiphilus sp.]
MKWILAILAMGLVVSVTAQAQSASCTTAGANNAFLGIQTVKLWPGDAPQAKGKTCEDTPTLTIFDPRGGNGNGSAVVILPGGGYNALASVHEGREVADWFTQLGFRAFILSYRLSLHGYLLPIPLLDARRAVQTVRARAADYHIDPNRIVIIGFSAGGHLAALAATQPVSGNPEAEDSIDRVSSRPNYLVLGYPWIGALDSEPANLSYCPAFKVEDRCAELRAAYAPDLFVTKDTPPTFQFHTFNDQRVPVEQGLRFYEALIKAGVQSEMHIFANGPHGVGFGGSDPALDQWPVLLEVWLRGQGLLNTEKSGDEKK